MLTQKMYEKMNVQMMLEFESSNLYKSMASWCQANGYSGSAKFLNQHAAEEMGHMDKLFNYINETGNQALLQALSVPQNQFESLQEVFQKTFTHEKLITQKIFELAQFALETQDFSTFSFLQWYTAEQHEEEALFQGILEKFEIIGVEGRGLFMIDKEIGLLANR